MTICKGFPCRGSWREAAEEGLYCLTTPHPRYADLPLEGKAKDRSPRRYAPAYALRARHASSRDDNCSDSVIASEAWQSILLFS